MRKSSIVLLSGGMDSATALFWAMAKTKVQEVLTFLYGQKGARYEIRAATSIMHHAHDVYGLTAIHRMISLPRDMDSALTLSDGNVLDRTTDGRGNVKTYVPARNLIFLSVATARLYLNDADCVVGGWVSQDSPYPDCTMNFLSAAEHAMELAIGPDFGGLEILAPLLYKSKSEVVDYGHGLRVPWKLTRSCYDVGERPCNRCRSCVDRIRAFDSLGLRDPLYSEEEWKEALECAKES